jgi:predicted nuclease of predicted toxin-antitoxin system
MRFLVDAQLPAALAQWLVTEGHAAEHVSDKQMQSASDSAIWDFAIEAGAVIITKDEDFARRRTLADAGPAVVWIRLPNTRRRALLIWFAAAAPEIVAALERGEMLVEVI